MKFGDLILDGLNSYVFIPGEGRFDLNKGFELPEALEEVECFALINETTKLVDKLEIDGQVYFPGQVGKVVVKKPKEQADYPCSKPEKLGTEPRKGGNIRYLPATAPYNFIPLPNEIVPGEGLEDRFDLFQKGKHNGYIDLYLKCLTPLYIRGEKTKFFEVEGTPTIPGSSLRGMVRNLVEIIANSAFVPGQHIDDTRLSNRSAFSIASRVRWYYRDRMQSCVPGFLKYDKETQEYYILPSNQPLRCTEPSDAKEFVYEVGSDKRTWTIYTGLLGKKKKHWIISAPASGTAKIFLSDEDTNDYRNDFGRKTRNDMANLLDTARSLDDGKFPYGLPVFFAVVDVGQEKTRVIFGHTRYFRLPYHLTIGDHVPANLKIRSKAPGLADSLFGFAEGDGIQSGKVWIENLKLVAGQAMQAQFSRILGSPKPTSFQLYLEQKPNGYRTNQISLDHWGKTGVNLRGYKLYWHQPDDGSWIARKPKISNKYFGEVGEVKPLNRTHSQGQDLFIDGGDGIQLALPYLEYSETIRKRLDKLFFPEGKQGDRDQKAKVQFKPIAPMETGSTFKGRIHFENLSTVELGALLFALDLDKGMAHKLGLGKPTGLGSVRLTPTLYLGNREQRYQSLFTKDQQWQDNLVQANLKDFKDAFASYMGKQLEVPGVSNATQYWDFPRMKPLKLMLTTEPAQNWGQHIHYAAFGTKAGLKTFKERHVLPTPEEVVDPKTYRR